MSDAPPRAVAGKRGSRTPPAPELRLEAEQTAKSVPQPFPAVLGFSSGGGWGWGMRGSAVTAPWSAPLAFSWWVRRNVGVAWNLWGLWASLHQAPH